MLSILTPPTVHRRPALDIPRFPRMATRPDGYVLVSGILRNAGGPSGGRRPGLPFLNCFFCQASVSLLLLAAERHLTYITPHTRADSTTPPRCFGLGFFPCRPPCRRSSARPCCGLVVPRSQSTGSIRKQASCPSANRILTSPSLVEPGSVPSAHVHQIVGGVRDTPIYSTLPLPKPWPCPSPYLTTPHTNPFPVITEWFQRLHGRDRRVQARELHVVHL